MPAMIFAEADTQRVRDGDVIMFFNFRADRARELSDAFLKADFDGFDRTVTPCVHYVTLTEYDETYACPAIFAPEKLDMVLGEAVAAAGKNQMRIAETEKYPHVTYFFNGGAEKSNPGEDRVIIPSPKDVPTYDFKPEMSAPQVTETVVSKLKDYDLVILNFANPDMVGHTGVVEAAIKAVETIDEGVGGGRGNPAPRRQAAHHRRPRQLRVHAQPRRLAQHRAHHQSGARGLRRRRRRELSGQGRHPRRRRPHLLDMLGLPKPGQMTGSSLLVRRG
jgi:2,3-bisphosphoglycerate-independent phosphoglycerate mutase